MGRREMKENRLGELLGVLCGFFLSPFCCMMHVLYRIVGGGFGGRIRKKRGEKVVFPSSRKRRY